MRTVDMVVIGAGHTGLATSYHLSAAGRDHVVLDRGRLAESWRSARWDSLRLLTPNWMSRLPGWSYQGPDSEGFMTAGELTGYLEVYARSFGAPVQTWTAVTDVAPMADGYRVTTTRGCWFARNVVLATGPRSQVPALSAMLAPDVWQVHTSRYRNPQSLPEGGVLIVGASASGAQIAAELRRAGRQVVLAVGSHTRLPRRYRGMDIMWWLEQTGALSRTIDDVSDPKRARRAPSLQLRGGLPANDVNLQTLSKLGVVVASRLARLDGHRAGFADDLAVTTAAAETQLRRILANIDAYVESTGLAAEVLPPEDIRPIVVDDGPDELDLKAAGITSVVWATGFRHQYPWLRVPVLDRDGEVMQRRGVTPAPGLYVIGQRFMHRRDSSFIDGARHDAQAICEHISERSRAPRARLAEGVARP